MMDRQGYSALTYALNKGHTKIAIFLIEQVRLVENGSYIVSEVIS